LEQTQPPLSTLETIKSPDVEILNAAFTPMHPDGSVNYERVPFLFEHAVRSGADGVFLNGTTGECMSLSLDERFQLIERWVSCRRKSTRTRFKIIAHVGGCNLFEGIKMAEHAQQNGVDGIAMVPTFYFRPRNITELVAQCAMVATGAAETPFYYYNIPSLTGVTFPMIQLMEVAAKRIPTFAGLKNSHSDIVDYQHCLHFAGDRHTLYWGMDEKFLMVHAIGNRRYVGSTYNYMSSIYHKMLHAGTSGNDSLTLQLQKEADAIYRVMQSFHGVTAGKEIMNFLGANCGPVRMPLQPLTETERESLLKQLKATNFFNHSNDSQHVVVDIHR
jgi:N-acetylneuraminate lyase